MVAMTPFTLYRGDAPLIVSLPHDGTHVPADIAARLDPVAREVPDTDWFVSRLYGFARGLGATVLAATHSRYVVDLNRGEDDTSLYPGQNTTGLCPVRRFDGGPVYLPGMEPTPADIAARVESVWRPYHATLAAELERLRALHPRVVLWEGHSIRGELPWLFEGRLPDLNLGTAGGTSCAPATAARVEAVLAAQAGYDWVANGRFKGGHITRHYGRPDAGIDALQLELAQRTYMDEGAAAWSDARAAALVPLLEAMLVAAVG
jgi:N-formylglutamate deformylase